jgi:hypothetical protein
MKVLLLATTLALTVSSCGASDGATDSRGFKAKVSSERGLPEGVDSIGDSSTGAGFVAGKLAVTTFGSSSNPDVVTGAEFGEQKITLSLGNNVHAPATADYIPTTSTLAIPDTIDIGKAVIVVLGDRGEVTVTGSQFAWLAAQN